MKKTILILGVIVLLIGTVTFPVGANISAESEINEETATDNFAYAKLELIDGELVVDGGLGWFSIRLPPYQSDEIARGYSLTTQAAFTVYSGELKVKPLMGEELTLVPGDSIYMRVSFELVTENLTHHRLTEFKGTAFGVEITYNTA